MRIVIQGMELTVTLKSDRELSTNEILMAHQLSTGNFESLFIEDSPTNGENTNASSSAIEKSLDMPVKKNEWIEKGTRVEVEILCPFCGYSGKSTTMWGNSFCKCPKCQEKLFNRFATDIPGEKNNYGCVYVAEEPMVFKNKTNEYIEMFSDYEKGEME
ncbi:hypothetical protein ACYSNU_07405 [Enterococcus sp. LJL120]